MSIALKNKSQYMERRGDTDWWRWTAYIDATSPDELDEIDYVEYQLHPTFPNPVRRVRKKENGFALNTSGWGVFQLKAKVVFEDKDRQPAILTHFLQFDGNDVEGEG
jgi:transcription initiation factor IIF auxiliary subunit